MESAFDIGLLIIVGAAWLVVAMVWFRATRLSTAGIETVDIPPPFTERTYDVGADDVQQQINGLRNELGDVKLQVAKVEGEVRIVKHDQANMKVGFDGFALRSEKTQDTMKADLKDILERVSALNVKQEKGVSFFAGVAAVISVSAGFVVMLVKILFSSGAQ